MSHSGVALVRSAAVLISKPLGWLSNIHARFLIVKFKGLMPTVALSVSDPISAIVIAALDFLSTPVGQTLAAEVNTEIVNIIKFVHSKLPALPVPSVTPPKAA